MNDSTNNLGQKALKAGVWYMISTIVVKAINVITTPIYTRMLSTEDYGIAANFASWYALLIVIFSLDVELSVGRAKQDFSGHLNKYIGSLEVLCVSIALIISILVMPIRNYLAKAMELTPLMLNLLLVHLLFAPIVLLTQTKLRYEYKYKGNIAISIFLTVANIAITLLLLSCMKEERYIGKVLGSVIPTCVIGLGFWIFEIKNKNVNFNKGYCRYALAISLPMLMHTLAMNLLSQSDRVVITKISGSSATAIYTLAYQYAILINIVMQAISQAWLPWFHDNYYLGRNEEIKEKVKLLTLFGCFVGVGCIALAPEAIAILGPESYLEGVYVVAPVALGIICQFMYSNYINVELHVKNTKYASIGTLIAALFNIIANFIFIPIFGFVAAAYTTLASYLLLWIIHIYITKKILNIHLYDDGFFVIAFCVSTIITIILQIFFENFLIRLLLIIAISLLILVFMRGEIIKVAKMITKR